MRSKRWEPTSNNLDGLLFEGAPALLSQLDDLIVRPRHWWRETLLPIIYLACEPTAKNPLDGLADRLRQAGGVPHSRINGRETSLADTGQSPEKSIRRILDGAVADLSQRSGRGRPLRFPHYSLVVWLASLITNRTEPHQPDQPGRRVDNALQDFIKERYRFQNKATSTEASMISDIPGWVRIPVLLLPSLGIRLMRIFWRPPKWVAKSRIASEYSSGSFRGLALKLMEQGSGEHQHNIQQHEIDHLLVDAFMEDLRRAYRRTALFFFGLRRTTHPVLLIDNVRPAAANLHLLKMISDCRTGYLRTNTAGPGRQPRARTYFHPLLIIAQGDSSALDGIRPSNYQAEDHGSYSTADIKYYYSEWYRALADSGRTWFIPLRVPAGRPPQGLRAELTNIRLPAAPRPVLVFAAAALLIIAVSFTTYDTYATHCGAWYWEPQLQRTALTTSRDQCVGLGSSAHRFFDDVGNVNGVDQKLAAELKNVETKIYDTNEQVARDPKHLTVVYLSQLTSQDAADYRSELEQLRGIVVAQQDSIADRPVRVLLANGGYKMNNAAIAAEAIAREARKDTTLVAVVGLGISREGTRNAMMRLARPDTHIPMIGTDLSASDLATKTTPYYHQVGATNQREADVAAFYATTQLKAKNATIFYPDDKDELYGNDLRDQAKRAFEAQGIAVREQPYRIDTENNAGNTNLIGRAACDVGPQGVVFYTGRTEDFSVFLDGMRTGCEGHYPHFLGGDEITRSALDGKLDKFPGLIVDYVSKASSLAWGSNCSGAIDRVGFFASYRELFGDSECASLRDGSSSLAHDALLVFTQGVRNTGVNRPTPDAVLAGIADISSAGPGAVHGVSGLIDYPRTSTQAIPRDKAVLVLRGGALMAPYRVLLCGQLDTAQPPPDENCPKQTGP